MIIRMTEMAWADYEGLNIRLRTVFKNNKNERWFIEVSTGVVGKPYSWLVISHLFRIDIEEDYKNNYTKSANKIIDEYYDMKVKYTKENVIKLLEKLGLENVELKLCKYEEYNTNNNELGNLETKYEQLSLFD